MPTEQKPPTWHEIQEARKALREADASNTNYCPSSELQVEIEATEKRLRELRSALSYAERQESIWAEDEHL